MAVLSVDLIPNGRDFFPVWLGHRDLGAGQLENMVATEAKRRSVCAKGCWIDPWREDCFNIVSVPMTASGLQGEKPMAIEVW